MSGPRGDLPPPEKLSLLHVRERLRSVIVGLEPEGERDRKEWKRLNRLCGLLPVFFFSFLSLSFHLKPKFESI